MTNIFDRGLGEESVKDAKDFEAYENALFGLDNSKFSPLKDEIDDKLEASLDITSQSDEDEDLEDMNLSDDELFEKYVSSSEGLSESAREKHVRNHDLDEPKEDLDEVSQAVEDKLIDEIVSRVEKRITSKKQFNALSKDCILIKDIAKEVLESNDLVPSCASEKWEDDEEFMSICKSAYNDLMDMLCEEFTHFNND